MWGGSITRGDGRALNLMNWLGRANSSTLIASVKRIKSLDLGSIWARFEDSWSGLNLSLIWAPMLGQASTWAAWRRSPRHHLIKSRSLDSLQGTRRSLSAQSPLDSIVWCPVLFTKPNNNRWQPCLKWTGQSHPNLHFILIPCLNHPYPKCSMIMK